MQFIEAIIELFLDRSSRVEEITKKKIVFGQRLTPKMTILRDTPFLSQVPQIMSLGSGLRIASRLMIRRLRERPISGKIVPGPIRSVRFLQEN